MIDEPGDEPILLSEPAGGVPDVTDTLEGYTHACAALSKATGPIAVDAERAYGYRYSHRDWLIQCKREGAGIFLLDPVALAEAGVDWNVFNEAVHGVTWILHDARQDLPGFAELGLKPSALFDTEVAARLLGQRKYGLASVVEHYLGLRLAKEHSASDWSTRPLPRDWRNYAALDVEVLAELAERMRQDLEQQGKTTWAEEEFAYVLEQGLAPKPKRVDPWTSISHFTSLSHDRRAQAVAKSLWEERDRLARRYDIEPTLLLADAAIVEAALKKPHNASQFRAIRSLNERVRVHGVGRDQRKMFERYAPIQRSVKPSVWKQAIQDALDLPRSQWPQYSVHPVNAHGKAPRSLKQWRVKHPERLERLQLARAVVEQVAQDTHTSQDMILSPRILRSLCWCESVSDVDVAGFMLGEGARHWQVDLVAESVSRVII